MLSCYLPKKFKVNNCSNHLLERAIGGKCRTAHETTHWTRHPNRLDRSFGRKRYGDEGYAQEELVAELGSAFLSADLGITPEVRDDHAAYIDSWLEVLKKDKRAIFSAAAHAQRAADFLHGFQLEPTSQQEVA